MTRAGEVVWESTLPFTYYEALVEDDGSAFGYAYTHGYEAYREAGELLVVSLSDQGEVAFEQRHGRDRRVMCGTVPDPAVHQLVRHGKQVLMHVWRAYDPEQFWIYDGERSAQVAEAEPPRRLGWSSTIEALPGTPLLLASVAEVRDKGARYVLLDDEYHEVWTARNLYMGSSAFGITRSGDSAYFTLRTLLNKEDVTYSARQSTAMPSGWDVDEVQRIPVVETIPAAPDDRPPRALDELGRIPLAARRVSSTLDGDFDRTTGAPLSDRVVHDPATVVLDHLGRFLLFDAKTGVVHTFEPSGEYLALCRPHSDDYRHIPFAGDLTVDGRGHVFVGTRFDPHYIEFDTEGTRVGRVTFPASPMRFVPGSREAWRSAYQDLKRLDETHEVVTVVNRRADRTWLRSTRNFAIARNGAVAVVDQFVNLYDPDGAPLASYPSPIGARGRIAVAYEHGWVALGQGIDIFLLRAADGKILRLAMGVSPDIMIPHDAEELWIRPREALEVVRYALPD